VGYGGEFWALGVARKGPASGAGGGCGDRWSKQGPIPYAVEAEVIASVKGVVACE
jgi:hypothetical protein